MEMSKLLEIVENTTDWRAKWQKDWNDYVLPFKTIKKAYKCSRDSFNGWICFCNPTTLIIVKLMEILKMPILSCISAQSLLNKNVCISGDLGIQWNSIKVKDENEDNHQGLFWLLTKC